MEEIDEHRRVFIRDTPGPEIILIPSEYSKKNELGDFVFNPPISLSEEEHKKIIKELASASR